MLRSELGHATKLVLQRLVNNRSCLYFCKILRLMEILEDKEGAAQSRRGCTSSQGSQAHSRYPGQYIVLLCSDGLFEGYSGNPFYKRY